MHEATRERLRRVLPAAVTMAVLVVGLLIGQDPFVGVMAAGALIAVGVTFWKPEFGTAVVCFLLYSNAPVIATKFHGVPYLAAAAFPMLLVVPIGVAIFVQRERIIVTKAVPWLIAFMTTAALSALLARDPAASLLKVMGLVLEGALIFLLIINAVRDLPTLRRVTWALVAAGILLGGVPIYQQFTGSFHSDFGGFGQLNENMLRTGHYRLTGAIGEQNRYAEVMLLLLPLSFMLIEIERKPLLRVAAALSTCIIALAFFLALSRGAFVALVMLIGAAALLRAVSVRRLLIATAGVVLIVAMMPQLLTRFQDLPVIGEYMPGERARTVKVDSAVTGRITSMLASGQAFVDHPLLGVGPGMFGPHHARRYGNELNIRRFDTGREAHNLYLGIAAEHGILGSAAFGMLLLVIIDELRRLRRRTDDPVRAGLATAYLLAVLAFMFSGIFLHLAYVRYLFFLLALASAAGSVTWERPQPAPRNDPSRDPELVAAPVGA